MTNYTDTEKFALERALNAIEEEKAKLRGTKIGCLVLTAASVVAAIYCGKKLKDVCGVMNSAITDVASMTYIDVQASVVEKAVEKAAQNAAGKAVRDVQSVIKDRVDTAVCSAVANAKGHIKEAVTAKVSQEVADIDKSELTAEITAKAKQMMLDKFDGTLDGIASEYSKNLENMGKIYQTIAEKMQGKEV